MSKWIWILISGLGWPAAQFLWLQLRPEITVEGPGFWQAILDFGLAGLAAGWLYFFLRERAVNDRQRKFAKLGYWVASPFALVGMFVGGFFISPVMVGALVMGVVPLLIGGWLGRLLGGMGSAG